MPAWLTPSGADVAKASQCTLPGPCRRDGKGLAELMRELAKLEGLHWMRILYAYPSYFTDELIDEIANNAKVR
jgi:tRNA A37 methylthiotransferase MiaB